jgi:hypothetical protein
MDVLPRTGHPVIDIGMDAGFWLATHSLIVGQIIVMCATFIGLSAIVLLGRFPVRKSRLTIQPRQVH